MERPNLRPAVTITTYSAPFKRQADRAAGVQAQEEPPANQATRSEFSTDLFNKFRLQTSNRPALAGRLLVELNQIKGPTGSIRGHKDVVRKSLEGIRVAHTRRLFDLSCSLGASFGCAPTASPSLSSSSSGASNNSLLRLQANSIMTYESNSNHDERQQLQTLQNLDQIYHSQYLARLQDEELGQCVAYTTSLGIVRRTFEDSKQVKSILNINLIDYEERDIFLNQEFKHQLRLRLSPIVVPALFVDGKHIGGLKELELMNENGQLVDKLRKFKLQTHERRVCPCCGNAKFIACQSCNGSRKSTIHHFKFNSIALRCIKCDKNDGLVQCPVCTPSARQQQSHQQLSSSDEQQESFAIDHNNNNSASSQITTTDKVNGGGSALKSLQC